MPMESKQTLVGIFESNKSQLEQKLKELKLPTDSSKMEEVVCEYLNAMFDKEGDFRQNLTISEDYVLEAALSLLNLQRELMQKLLLADNIPQECPKSMENKIKPSLSADNVSKIILGNAVGGVVGSWVGTWGAVFGSVAGCAMILYYLSQNNPGERQTVNTLPESQTEMPVNTDLFIRIVRQVCQSVDHLMDTFRTQLQRVASKYESMEKPTLEKEYGILLECIQSLLGARYSDVDDTKYLKKLQSRTDTLAESLENYNLVVEPYTEENKNWFEAIVSEKIREPLMIYPAISKNGSVVKQGKVFIPEIEK